MPIRTITADARRWRVFPSGFVTANQLDECGLLFVAGEGADREVRLTRFSPVGSRTHDRAIAELTEAQLADLLLHSQPSDTAAETGYRTSPAVP